MTMAIENESKQTRLEHEQQREDREERVVRDRGGHVTNLILRVLPEHREHKPGGAVMALPAVERTLPVGHHFQAIVLMTRKHANYNLAGADDLSLVLS